MSYFRGITGLAIGAFRKLTLVGALLEGVEELDGDLLAGVVVGRQGTVGALDQALGLLPAKSCAA